MSKFTTNYIMNVLLDQDIFYFQPKQLSLIFDVPMTTAYDLIQKLKKRQVIIEIEHGKYLVSGYDAKRLLSNPFYIATNSVVPSYVSYWSILNYYGFTEQVPRTVFLATTKQKKQIRFNNTLFKYIHIKTEKLYGYTKEFIDGFPVFLAEKEKAILDSIDLPQYAGGMKEVAHCLGTAIDTLNKKKLIDYAARFPSKSMISRLGYLCEKHGVNLTGLDRYKSSTYVLLNQHKQRSDTWNKHWMVNVNEEV